MMSDHNQIFDLMLINIPSINSDRSLVTNHLVQHWQRNWVRHRQESVVFGDQKLELYLLREVPGTAGQHGTDDGLQQIDVVETVGEKRDQQNAPPGAMANFWGIQ